MVNLPGLLTGSQWPAIGLNALMGLMFTAAFLAYVHGFHETGPLSWSAAYFTKLLLNPWVLIGIGLSAAVTIMRFMVFHMVGGQRAWFLAPIGTVVNTAIVVAVLREPMSITQWLGAAVILIGVVLVSTERISI